MHRGLCLAVALMLLSGIILTASDTQANDSTIIGVHAGDRVEYCLRVSYTTDDPGPMISPWPTWIDAERGKVEILSVVGANATYETTVAFRDKDEISDINSVDFSAGIMDHGPRWPVAHGMFVAANLSVGDPGVNATLMRYYAGAQREVNYFGLVNNRSSGMGWVAAEAHFYFDRSSGIFVEEDFKIQYYEGNYMTNASVISMITDTNVWTSVAYPLIPVSFGSSVTIYEKTTNVYVHNFSVSDVMGAGGTFSTNASERYDVTSDGTYLKIRCYRSSWRSGLGVGNNIVAVRLDGAPSCPDGLWATVIVNYTLGFNGIAESRFNALGPDTQIGPYIPMPGAGLCTRLGDQFSDITIGFNSRMPNIESVCSMFGTNILDQNWDPNMDVSGDCKVDMRDVGFVCRSLEQVLKPKHYTYNVVNSYPHDKTAFTQGLVFEDGVLFESTGLYTFSTLRRVELETGEVLQIHYLPDQFFGEGITIFNDKIIQLTWRTNIGFVYDKHTFDLLREFSYPTEGWGITHDGSQLIMSDGTATLYFLDPVTFEAIGQVEVYDNDPVTMLNELEYIRGEVYANIWMEEKIAIINPQTGKVRAWIDLGGLQDLVDQTTRDVLNGIAYDAKDCRLFVTGKKWSQLFEIELIPIE